MRTGARASSTASGSFCARSCGLAGARRRAACWKHGSRWSTARRGRRPRAAAVLAPSCCTCSADAAPRRRVCARSTGTSARWRRPVARRERRSCTGRRGVSVVSSSRELMSSLSSSRCVRQRVLRIKCDIHQNKTFFLILIFKSFNLNKTLEYTVLTPPMKVMNKRRKFFLLEIF